jgi:hypothetical protein
MISRVFFSLVVSLLLCATTHANPSQIGVVATSMPTDLNLVACHATLAGLTVLGIVLAMRRRPAAMAKARVAV